MKKQAILITVLTLVCLFFSIAGLSIFKASAKDSVSVDIVSENILDKYSLNSQVQFPAEISVNHNGQNYTASKGVIVYPNGISYALFEHKLDQAGEYEIKYFFNNDKLNLTAVKKFKVLTNYYGFLNDDGSSVVGTFNDGDNVAQSLNKQDAIRVTFKDGNEFLFNEPINLKNEKGGVSPIINLTPVMGDHTVEETAPNSGVWINNYTPFAKKCKIRITDCYNPKIFVEIIYDFGNQGCEYQGYFRVGSNSQADIGVTVGKPNANPNGGTTVNYKQDGVDSGACVGTWGNYNTAVHNSAGITGTGLFYDYELNRVYYQQGAKALQLINDLENTQLYGENVFEGFTTGEVYLSVKVEEFFTNSVTVDVHSIGNYTAKQLDALKGVEYVDVLPPQVSLVAQTTTENGFYGAIGDTIVIPKAISSDINKEGEIIVNVYKNYYSEKPVKVTVVNDTFKINSPDTYTIEYLQKDSFGNIGVKAVDVVPKYVENNSSIYVETQKLTQLEAGKVNVLPVYEIKSLNRLDLAEITIKATNANQEIEIGNDLSFIPETTGEWVITYQVKDNFGVGEFSYKVNCVPSDSVNFKQLPNLPRYFIKGQKYNIGQVYAYTYTGAQPTQNLAELFVSFDGGEKTKVAAVNAVEITGSNYAQFSYEYGGKVVVSDQVKIVDVVAPQANKVDMFKYFVGNVDYQDQPIEGKRPKALILKAKGEDAKVEFVNAIDGEHFTVKYQVPEDLANFEAIRFTLTSVDNDAEKSVYEIRKDGKKIALYVDGEFAFDLDKQFTGNRDKALAYSGTIVSFDGKFIRKQANFTSALVYLDIELLGVSGDAGIRISEINGQKLTGDYSLDTVAPQVTMYDARGEYVVGETVKLAVPVCSDVLSQINYTAISLRVYDTAGNVIKDKNGLELNLTGIEALKEYEIVIENIETYFVSYNVKDYANRSVEIKYTLVGVDTQAPTITFADEKYNSSKVIEVAKGGNINVTYSVNDNISSQANIKNMVRIYDLRTGVYCSVEDSAKIEFNRVGDFMVKVLAFDEAGNMAQKTFNVTVK